MSLLQIFDIAGSGLSAQTLRLNITASNMANANTDAGSAEEAYKARQPVFRAMLQDNLKNRPSLGVSMAGVVENQAEHEMRYEPGNPLANEEGYVFASNVNPVEEMANMLSASRSYQNNIEVLNTSRQLLLQTLKLGE